MIRHSWNGKYADFSNDSIYLFELKSSQFLYWESLEQNLEFKQLMNLMIKLRETYKKGKMDKFDRIEIESK